MAGSWASADVVVTKAGKRFEGEVSEEGDSWVLVTKAGGKVAFPKDAVKEVIRSADYRPRYEQMRAGADLLDDAAVDKLARFAGDAGLQEERSKLLDESYAARLAAAKEEFKPLRSLHDWCERYALKDLAATCGRRADELEFATRFKAAAGNPVVLHELARWCLANHMPAGVTKCLENEYAEKKKDAVSAQDCWDLAAWCGRWNQTAWQQEQQLAAVRLATEQGDAARLETFMAELGKEGESKDARRECARGVADHRYRQASGDVRALTALALWCREEGIAVEAAQVEEDVLRRAPEDPALRKTLGFVRNVAEGRWVKLTADQLKLAEVEKILLTRPRDKASTEAWEACWREYLPMTAGFTPDPTMKIHWASGITLRNRTLCPAEFWANPPSPFNLRLKHVGLQAPDPSAPWVTLPADASPVWSVAPQSELSVSAERHGKEKWFNMAPAQGNFTVDAVITLREWYVRLRPVFTQGEPIEVAVTPVVGDLRGEAVFGYAKLRILRRGEVKWPASTGGN